MADSLLQDARNIVGIVDTTGHFDILRLYAFLFARIQDDAGLLERFRHLNHGEEEIDDDVTAKMLDRVKIMRAFDLVGVMEAVGEVSDGLEGRRPPPTEDNPTRMVERGEEIVSKDPQNKDQQTIKEKSTTKQENTTRTFVADSDEEDELLFDDEPAGPQATTAEPAKLVTAREENELLFVDGADDRIAVSSPPWNSPLQSASQTPIDMQAGSHSSHKGMTFLLIDNLAHVVSPLLKKDYVQGNAVATHASNV